MMSGGCGKRTSVQARQRAISVRLVSRLCRSAGRAASDCHPVLRRDDISYPDRARRRRAARAINAVVVGPAWVRCAQ
jgi:hypothetical protein